MKLAHLRSFFTSMDGKSTVLFLRQFQGIYEEKPMGLFPGLLEPTPLKRALLFVLNKHSDYPCAIAKAYRQQFQGVP